MSSDLVAPLRLAYLVTHPIQYQAPLLRLIAEQPDIDLEVFFLSDVSMRAFQEEGFGREIKWDVPLTDGYFHNFLSAWGDRDRISFLRPFSRGITRALLGGHFDALWVHSYGHWSILYLLALARIWGIRTLVRTESTRIGTVCNLSRALIRPLFYPFLKGITDRALAIGSLNREHWVEEVGLAADRVHLMGYAVDNRQFQERVQAYRPARSALKASLGLDPDRPVILFASKFIPRKRAGDLLEAYQRLSVDGNQEPRPYLLYVGDGEERKAIQAQAEAIGWGSIRFLGFKNQTELPAYYDLCDVFVLPSELEPWGLVVNEVMNAGKAVIVSDEVGCAPDLIDDGDNGYICPKGDLDALAQALRRVTGDPVLAARMGQRSLERIEAWSYAENLKGLRCALGLPERADA